MIDKKIIWLGGAGAAALSIAIAITINVNINKDSGNQTTRPNQLTCVELQQAINNLSHPGFDQLPESIKTNVVRIGKQEEHCYLQGKGWELIAGKIKQSPSKETWKKAIGKETTDTTDGKSMLDIKF